MEENRRRMIELLTFVVREFNPFLLVSIVENGIHALIESDPNFCDYDFLLQTLDDMRDRWLIEIIESVKNKELS